MPGDKLNKTSNIWLPCTKLHFALTMIGLVYASALEGSPNMQTNCEKVKFEIWNHG